MLPRDPAGTLVATRRVLILAYAFLPENLVGTLRPARFSKYLPEFGFSIQVVTASAQDPGTLTPQVCYVKDPTRDGLGFFGKVLRKVESLLMKVYASGGGSQALSWIPSAVKKSEERMPFDCIISTSPPIATHLAALCLKLRHPGLGWVADFRDPLYGNPSRIEKRTRFWDEYIERLIFRHADRVIATTDALADVWRARYPRWKSKVTHIWNGFDPADDTTALPLPSRNRRIVAHVGDIYGGRHPEQLILAVQHLLESAEISPSSIEFSFVGYVDKQYLQQFDKLIQRGVLSLSPLSKSHEEARRLMAEADSLVLVDWTDGSGGLQVPAKLFVYIQIGRPILAITKTDSPVDRILSMSDVPYVCLYPGDSVEQSAAKLQKFLSLPSSPVPPSDWFLREFDGRKQAQSLAGILRSFMPGS
jgi:glycosyltransferase involved in cell wall biosynthesis